MRVSEIEFSGDGDSTSGRELFGDGLEESGEGGCGFHFVCVILKEEINLFVCNEKRFVIDEENGESRVIYLY
jgi:hypothetical protein